MKKLLKSKQGKTIAFIVTQLLASSLPALLQPSNTQPPASIKEDAEWHIDGKLKIDKH
jgi:hypothetical protein